MTYFIYERGVDHGSLHADSVEQAAGKAAHLLYGRGIMLVERLTGLGGQPGWFQAYRDSSNARGKKAAGPPFCVD
jgi:hypothetical protein